MKNKKLIVEQAPEKLKNLKDRSNRAAKIINDSSVDQSEKLAEIATECMLMEQMVEDLLELYSEDSSSWSEKYCFLYL